ncbi:MAG: DUF6687 family protein, partial [Cyclobacteriaceae bacterium]
AMEPEAHTWRTDSIFDTGPIMRVTKDNLSKAQRYDHPFRRPIASSGLSKKEVLDTILDFFRHNLENVEQQPFWTWQEMRDINESLSLH